MLQSTISTKKCYFHYVRRFEVRLKILNIVKVSNLSYRTELSIYGRDHIISPNFDRLAAKSVVFDKAYCQIAVCCPSRNSILTGLRPDTTGSYEFQELHSGIRTLPEVLGSFGYRTAAYGNSYD
jgi:iduronate 2-sulfatase